MIGTRDERALSDILLAEMRLALDHWFDTYESEQSAFSPEMHSAASRLRQQLLPFRKALETTNAIVHRKRSHRLYMGEHALSSLRAIFEQPPVSSGSKLDADAYFADHRELFLDVRLDLQRGAGAMRVHRFVGIDWTSIQRDWADFVAASPTGALPGPQPSLVLDVPQVDAATQARLHADYVRRQITEEPYLAELLVERSLERPLVGQAVMAKTAS